jgi:hypothetical protein
MIDELQRENAKYEMLIKDRER